MVYHGDKSRRRPHGSGSLQCMCATFLIIFGTLLFWTSRDISKADHLLGAASSASLRLRERNGGGLFELRTIKLKNCFDFDVSVYYEDGLSGSYLTNIPPHERAVVSAATGHAIYATELTGMARLASVVVAPNVNEYDLGMTSKSSDSHDRDMRRKKALGNATISLNVAAKARQHPLVSVIEERVPLAMATKFRNMIPHLVDLWFIPRQGEPIFEGHIPFTHMTTTNAYVGHHFVITDHKKIPQDKSKWLCEVTVNGAQALYTLYDTRPSASTKPLPSGASALAAKEAEFMELYHKETGIHWRHYFGPLTSQGGAIGPRPPPFIFMWPARQIGDVHRVESPHGYWTCSGTADACQSKQPVTLDLEVVSMMPRAFMISDFLSDHEIATIINLANPRMGISHVGGRDQGTITSKTRTSTNAWLARHSSPEVNSVYLRVADLLNIDEDLLHHNKNAEDMQVVHYEVGQKYDPHHDWGIGADEKSRVLTLLIYLTDQEDSEAGGETAFAKGVGRTGQGFKVHPRKGAAVLFYNLLEDGNGDDRSMHAALAVNKGAKYAANIWVWDPVRGS